MDRGATDSVVVEPVEELGVWDRASGVLIEVSEVPSCEFKVCEEAREEVPKPSVVSLLETCDCKVAEDELEESLKAEEPVRRRHLGGSRKSASSYNALRDLRCE